MAAFTGASLAFLECRRASIKAVNDDHLEGRDLGYGLWLMVILLACALVAEKELSADTRGVLRISLHFTTWISTLDVFMLAFLETFRKKYFERKQRRMETGSD